MQIKYVNLDELKEHPKNRNIHPPEQINRLASAIEYQSFRVPIIVSNLSGFIVAGHGRLEAAKKQGLKTVPVIYQDFNDEAQEYAFMTSDNAITLWAQLNFGAINNDIIDFGPDFNLDMLGIQHFTVDVSDKMVETVNRGDENSEWCKEVEQFEANQETILKLIMYFPDEAAREKYVVDNNLNVSMKMCKQWIVKF